MVSVYGVEEVGEVKRTSALREVGKSFRKTFVSSRWCVGCEEVCSLPCGESVRDQASPLRKSVFAVLSAGAELVDVDSWSRGFEDVKNCWLALSRSAWWRSSHCVSHFPPRKSGCATIARSTEMFVFTPVMEVSSSVR